jgi:hypothetical protein
MPASLEGPERTDMAGAAGAREIAGVNGAPGIRRVQDVPVRLERFESGRVAAVTALASDTMARMDRAVPVIEMVARWSGEIGEVAVGAAALGEGWKWGVRHWKGAVPRRRAAGARLKDHEQDHTHSIGQAAFHEPSWSAGHVSDSPVPDHSILQGCCTCLPEYRHRRRVRVSSTR